MTVEVIQNIKHDLQDVTKEYIPFEKNTFIFVEPDILEIFNLGLEYILKMYLVYIPLDLSGKRKETEIHNTRWLDKFNIQCTHYMFSSDFSKHFLGQLFLKTSKGLLSDYQ